MGETPDNTTTAGGMPDSAGETPETKALQTKYAELESELANTRQALTAANKEAAERRHRLTELEAAEEARKQAELSDAEKAQENIAALQRENAALLQEYQDTQIRSEIRMVASQMGLINPDDAYFLVDMAGIAIDPDKGVTGVTEALEALVKQKPYLRGDPAKPAPPSPDGGVGSPPETGGATLNPRENFLLQRAQQSGYPITAESVRKRKGLLGKTTDHLAARRKELQEE